MPPVYFFVIDVSYSAVASGMVATAAAAIADCLDGLPGDERTLVGFLTFDRRAALAASVPTASSPTSLCGSAVPGRAPACLPAPGTRDVTPDPFVLNARSSLHFYALKPGAAAPQMLVVTELDDPFVPLPDELLVNLRESRATVGRWMCACG
jgi:protein transport protein SEC24